VVSNMLPDAAHPERGRFVRDQVVALRRLAAEAGDEERPGEQRPSKQRPGERRLSEERPGKQRPGERPREGGRELEVELFELAPGARSLVAGTRELHRRYRGERFDVVHAHFGLSAYPALAARASVRGLTVHGTDVTHPRTRQLTRAVLPAMSLVAAASEPLVASIPGRRARERARVLPCGVDTERFRPMRRSTARAALGLDGTRPCLLLPADPDRPEKRADRAQELARAVGGELLTLGGVDPLRVPLYVNAADVVVVPSEREGFGLAALEALACDVPVLATPVGVHQQALDGVAGCLCAPFELERWRAALEPHVQAAQRPGDGPRVQGRLAAERLSSERMARLLAEAWRSLLVRGR
jgi:teichuronic acid biosynthesis glycosyltransferase TuaC